jgi:hypothetical protein
VRKILKILLILLKKEFSFGIKLFHPHLGPPPSRGRMFFTDLRPLKRAPKGPANIVTSRK